MKNISEKTIGKHTKKFMGIPDINANSHNKNKVSQESSGFRYMYSNSEHTHIGNNGKMQTYKVCDICGTEQQSNYGFEVSYAKHGTRTMCRMGLCQKCANKLVPVLENALAEIDEIENSMFKK